MGVDWVPARPRSDVDVDELRALIDAQGQAVPGVEGELLARLDIRLLDDGAWPSFRVAVVGHNPRFPPEWRSRSYSSFLPADAVAAVARWQWWYGEITAGHMRHYLERLIAHETSQQLEETQAGLLTLVDRASTRTNAWTRTGRFRQACARARALPAAPAVAAAGAPPATTADDAPTASQVRETQALAEHITLVNNAIREFNRSVPTHFKAFYCPRLLVDAAAPDPWVEEFFAWVTPSLEEGYGLYLCS